MSSWSYDSPPKMSGKDGTSNTQKAIATNSGWQHPTTGEVLVAIRGLATKAGAADTLSVAWGVTPAAGGVASVIVYFNEKVNVVDGASIVVNSSLRASAKLTSSTTAVIAGADSAVLGTGAAAKTYVWNSSITAGSAANQVKLGATAQASMTNLLGAINLTGTAGTNYAASTTIHSTVMAVSTTATQSTVSVTVTETAGIPVSGTTVAIGSLTYTLLSTTASVTVAGNVFAGALGKNTISNLQGAIVARDGLSPSTSWYIVAAAHPTVTATLTSVTTLTVSSLTSGVENNIVFICASQTLPNSAVGNLMTGGTSVLKIVSAIGGSVTTTCSITVANKATIFTNGGSVTQLIGGSTTTITLISVSASAASAVTFDRKSGDSSTQHVWATQPQVVSVSTGPLGGSIVDSTNSMTSITTISASATTLGSYTIAYIL